MKNQTSTTNKTWYGIDRSLEISLFEYGLAVKPIGPTEDNMYEVIYRITDNRFDTTSVTEEEVNRIIDRSWFNSIGFFSLTGLSKDKWLNFNIAIKLYDLLLYSGYENIIGSAHYTGLTEAEVRSIVNL